MRKRTLQAIAVGFLLFLSGCATGISGKALSEVTYRGTFQALQATPHVYVGQTALLGGKIIETRAASNAYEIVVLQLPLAGGNHPIDTDRSEGRFLIRSGQLLDPEIYRSGEMLTVVGRMIDSETRPIGNFDYVYPILEPIEIKLWNEPEWNYPLFFNIGVGASF